MEAGKLAILTLPSSFCQSGKAGRVQLGAGKLETIPVSSRSLASPMRTNESLKGEALNEHQFFVLSKWKCSQLLTSDPNSNLPRIKKK